MGFEEIVGQSRAVEDLQRAHVAGRIPNAYLFAGPRGVGKASTGMILARLLNCLGPRQDQQPCDICNACRKITHGNHPDVWWVEPEKKTLKISQIREMQRIVRFPPQEAQMRVVVVDGVEKMNLEAANAFLKTLEEPPPDNLFLLITSQPSRLLPTIISRCQRVPFAPIRREALRDLLVEAHGFDPIVADLAAGVSEGSVGKAIELHELLAGEERRWLYQQLPQLHHLPQGALVAMEIAEKVAKGSEQIGLYLTLLRIWYRDLLFLREVPEPEPHIINRDFATALREHAQSIQTSAIVRIIHTIEESEAAFLRNAAAQLTLEQLFLTLSRAQSLV